jgi:hypothetical protein
MSARNYVRDVHIAIPSIRGSGRVRLAAGAQFFVGLVNVGIGFLALQAANQEAYSTTAMQVVLFVMLIGALFLLLGVLTLKRSKVALGFAVAIYSLDGLLSLGTFNLLSVVAHIVFLSLMLLGFSGIQNLNDSEYEAQVIAAHNAELRNAGWTNEIASSENAPTRNEVSSSASSSTISWQD